MKKYAAKELIIREVNRVHWSPERIIHIASRVADEGVTRLIEDLSDNTLTAEQVMYILEKISHVSEPELRSRTRMKHVRIPRQIGMTYLAANNGMRYNSLKFIGTVFKRDHATVLHACKCVSNAIQTRDKDYMDLLFRFEFEAKKINEKVKINWIYERISRQ